MVFAAILAAGMSVEKQLEAAQKFLRGIRSLTSYEEVRDKQALHVGVQKALDKVQCFAAAQAAAWLAQVQPDFWGDFQAESFGENVAVKTRPVEIDQTRCLDLREPGHAQREGLQTARSWNAWEPCCSTGSGALHIGMCLHIQYYMVSLWFRLPTRKWRMPGVNNWVGIRCTCLTTCILLANGWRSWHGTSLVSRRENRIREFLWCRRCAWLLRQARRSLRAAKVEAETSP